MVLGTRVNQGTKCPFIVARRPSADSLCSGLLEQMVCFSLTK